ncbi:small ribosomal subunit protein uS9-like [Lepus europaeus]|uniref:small ribosomal subunit protein uS9-like n=1 Tax=Lepus europaeus TaxID=9983 RepID=UPI002B49659D|nr:small ribosomal subunit protein uS9-like [Lepus europaeus]
MSMPHEGYQCVITECRQEDTGSGTGLHSIPNRDEIDVNNLKSTNKDTRRQPQPSGQQTANWTTALNARSLEVTELPTLQYKLLEIILLLGLQQFAGLVICILVKSSDPIPQIHIVHQSISKALMAHKQKHAGEASRKETKATLTQYDQTLLVADPHHWESREFGGPGAHAHYQKSYR